MVYTFCVVDVKEYISSGIIESVVLGFASEQEVREVSCMSHIYPEIKEELDAISLAFEKKAFESAVEPAPELKNKVMAAIRQTEQIQPEKPEVEIKETKIVSLHSGDSEVNTGNPWKWMAAACAIMTLGAGLLWYTSAAEDSELGQQVAGLKKENVKSSQVLNAMVLQQERAESIQKVLTGAATKNINLGGLPKDPAADVKIMWDNKSEKAVMFANSITPPPTDMQYQLWAIADGKPVSIGVFDYDELMAMTDPFDVYAKNVSAFAITLEKRGGSPVPTMENMVVMGAV